MALTQQQFMQLMGGKREPVTASLASVLDLIKKPLDYYAVDKRVPLVGGQSAADLIGLTGTQSLVQDFSQGKPMMRDGIADERFIDAASMIPMIKPAAIGAGKAAKYLGKEALRQGYEGTGLLGKIAPDMKMYAVPNNSPFVPNVKAGEELIVHHNIPATGLLNVDEFGGKLAVPSLGISKSSMPLTNFGEISLIGSKEMAIPSAKNPVWSFDAYTKRFPKIEMQGTKAGEQIIKNDFITPYGKFAEERDVINGVSELSKNLRNNIDTTSGKIRYLADIKELPNPDTFNSYYDFLNAARDKFRNLEQTNPNFQDNFNLWAKNKITNLNSTGEFKDVIYAGTNNQGKQKYIPATMDNFIKQLKGGAGEEGFNYGLAQMRAKVAPKFKTLSDVSSARNQIVSSEKFNDIKDSLNSEHDYLSDKLTEIINKKSGSYYSRQTADALLEDLYTGKYNPKDEFNKEYDALIPASIKNKAKKVASQLKSMPTEYFEAKPQRAVGLEEFQGAIIPKEASKETKDVLAKYGIKDIYEYGTPEERIKLFQKFGNKMFSAGFPVGVGSGLLDSKQKTD
jgi:hypothetical protein